MTELDEKIMRAYQSDGKPEAVNPVYLTLLHTMLYIPVQKEKAIVDDEPFRPLFTKIDNHYFLVAFDTLARLQTWANDAFDHMAYVELSGRDMIAGMNENVYLSLNVGTPFYKEFSPEEVKRIKLIVSKIDQLKLTE